jgi:NAD(P)-dependent dehydrogenase (short-subunit alcohol dehydrogenase family)
MGRALVEELAGLGVRDHARFPAIVNETFERTGRLDSLFNDAGIGAGTMSSTRACGSSPTV